MLSVKIHMLLFLLSSFHGNVCKVVDCRISFFDASMILLCGGVSLVRM